MAPQAHAISEWGHDFRSSYRQLSVLKVRLVRVTTYSSLPLLAQLPGYTNLWYLWRALYCLLIIFCSALTATATAQVQKDILTMLEMKDPFLATLTFNRPNIYYEVLTE